LSREGKGVGGKRGQGEGGQEPFSQDFSGQFCWGQSIPTNGTGYDQYGNPLNINSTQCSSLGLSVSVNSSNQITNTGFNYDGSGNMLTDGTNTYTWEAHSRLQSAAGVTYTYDGGGQRVMKSSDMLYWYGPNGAPIAETDASGNVLSEYVFFGRRRIARRDGSGNVSHYFGDHLGTAREITTSAGAVCYDADFYPFGGEMAVTNTCAQNYKFTGHERDTETGLDHTYFRKYESNLGRWLSPDPKQGCLAHPQQFNRYAYVANAPTNYTDPHGDIMTGPCAGSTLGVSPLLQLIDLYQSGSISFEEFESVQDSALLSTPQYLCVDLPLPTDLGVGGGQQPPVPQPPGTITCLGWLLSGSTRSRGCDYWLDCADGSVRLGNFTCGAGGPYASQKCPKDVIADCPEGLWVKCTVGNFCGPGIPNGP